MTNRLKALRLERGMTQEELARLAGVPRKALSEFENEKSIPNANTVIKTLKALDVPVTQMLLDFAWDEVEEPKPPRTLPILQSKQPESYGLDNEPWVLPVRIELSGFQEAMNNALKLHEVVEETGVLLEELAGRKVKLTIKN